jgi:hypothetical protein
MIPAAANGVSAGAHTTASSSTAGTHTTARPSRDIAALKAAYQAFKAQRAMPENRNIDPDIILQRMAMTPGKSRSLNARILGPC